MSKFFPAKFHTDENKMKKLLKKKNLAFEKEKKNTKISYLSKKKKKKSGRKKIQQDSHIKEKKAHISFNVSNFTYWHFQ